MSKEIKAEDPSSELLAIIREELTKILTCPRCDMPGAWCMICGDSYPWPKRDEPIGYSRPEPIGRWVFLPTVNKPKVDTTPQSAECSCGHTFALHTNDTEECMASTRDYGNCSCMKFKEVK